ncbi:hypothetical protein D9M73_174670 [compost metagenome]
MQGFQAHIAPEQVIGATERSGDMVLTQRRPVGAGGLDDTEVALEHLTAARRRTVAVGAAIGDGKGLAVVFLDIVDRDQ